MRRIWLPVIVTALVLAGCDWTQAGFNGVNSGNNDTETALSLANVGGLHTAWSTPAPWSSGTGVAQITVTGHNALALDGGTFSLPGGAIDYGGVFETDPATGAVGWSFQSQAALTIACFGTTFYRYEFGGITVSGADVLYLNTIDDCPTAPTPISMRALPVDINEGPTFLEGAVSNQPRTGAVVAGDGTVYALDQSVDPFGTPFSSTLLGGGVHYAPGQLLSPPTLGLHELFLTQADGHLVAINPTSSAVDWSRALPTTDLARPSTDGTRVYVVSGAHVLAFDSATGAPAWDITLPAAANELGPTIGENGRLYVQTADHLFALDASTGATAWSATIPASTSPNRPTVSNGVVYVASGSQLSLFDAAGTVGCAGAVCNPVATVALAGASKAPPVVAHGAVYVGAGESLVKLVP